MCWARSGGDLSCSERGASGGCPLPALTNARIRRWPVPSWTRGPVTVPRGVRNVADADAGLAEMLRVTRPGGRLVVCEFGHLPGRRLNALYERYLAAALPLVARRLSGHAEAYNYLAESIADWPAQPELARRIGAAGWRAVRWRNLNMGGVALHMAQRPPTGLPAARSP